jgi:hypothetical protein
VESWDEVAYNRSSEHLTIGNYRVKFEIKWKLRLSITCLLPPSSSSYGMPLLWDCVDTCEYHELLEARLTKALLLRALCLWLRFEKIDLAQEFQYSLILELLLLSFHYVGER